MSRLRFSIIAALAVLASGCTDHRTKVAAHAIGDADHGGKLAEAYGCGSCHEIPGVSGANGRVGPPLIHMGERTLIAGLLPNTPANMVVWLRTPQSIVPGNGMPNTAMSERDAKDVAAYLYTLR
jgi:cytochrome c